MSRRDELKLQLEALGMPEVSFAGGPRGVARNMAERKAWRAAHPEKAVRYEALSAELSALEKAEEAAQRARTHTLEVERMLRRVGLAGRDLEAARTPQATPALGAVKAWLPGERAWLVLAGSMGTGKTVAAAWAVWTTLNSGRSAQYRRMAEVARLSWFNEAKADLEELKRVHLLVLDDVGTEHTKEFNEGLVFDLLDARHAGRRRTILCTNLGDKSVGDRLGDRLADRVESDGLVVKMKGRSMRKPAATPQQGGRP